MIHPPKTIEEARRYRYNKWGGNPDGVPYKEGNCVEGVWTGGRGSMSYQCSRKATVGLYCKQHSPEAVAARRRKGKARFRRQMDALIHPERERERFRKALKAIVQAKGATADRLREIAEKALEVK